MSLDDLREGDAAILSGYREALPAAWRRRFEDLGLLPETPLVMGVRAPLGDPIQVRVRGTLLCLRRAEARHIEVRRS